MFIRANPSVIVLIFLFSWLCMLAYVYHYYIAYRGTIHITKTTIYPWLVSETLFRFFGYNIKCCCSFREKKFLKNIFIISNLTASYSQNDVRR